MTEVQWTGFYMIGTSSMKELKSSEMSFFGMQLTLKKVMLNIGDILDHLWPLNRINIEF